MPHTGSQTMRSCINVTDCSYVGKALGGASGDAEPLAGPENHALGLCAQPLTVPRAMVLHGYFCEWNSHAADCSSLVPYFSFSPLLANILKLRNENE